LAPGAFSCLPRAACPSSFEGCVMSLTSKQIKETSQAHMRRDLDSGGEWVCSCEACLGSRSLTGIEKVLDIRPLIREIEQIEDQLPDLPPGPERDAARVRYETLHDALAEVMAR